MGVGLYKKKRPFKLHVAGLDPDALNRKLERLGSFIKDPLFSQILRHVERDVVAYQPKQGGGMFSSSSSSQWPLFPAHTQPGDDELTMVWSYWEKGYGDVIANTLLPFGELLRSGAMPRHLALAGMRHATLLPPLHATTSTLCASERPNPPLLPRCESSCWRRIKLCAPEFFESTRDSWRSTVALDAATRAGGSMGETTPRDPGKAVAAAYAAARAVGGVGLSSSSSSSSSADPSTLHVVIAARHGRRLLVNAQQLAEQCDGDVIQNVGMGGPLTLRCTVLPADSPQAAKVEALRRANVYVSVWGGDTVHSLHMRHGSGVMELRNIGFAQRAPWSWLGLHQRWVTRFSGAASDAPLKFFPIMVPANSSVLSSADKACFLRNTYKQTKWKEQQAALPENATDKQRNRRMPDDGWLCYWNADMRVEFPLLRPYIEQYARNWRRGGGGPPSSSARHAAAGGGGGAARPRKTYSNKQAKRQQQGGSSSNAVLSG